MLTLIFFILFFAVFGSILKFSLKAAWGITKLVLCLVVLPILMLALLVCGLLVFAIPILIVLGIIFLVKLAVKA